MIKENRRPNLRDLVIENIQLDLAKEVNNYYRFRGYLRKTSQTVYSLLDHTSHSSIKCVFNTKALEDYLETQPSYIDFNSFDYCQVVIKKYKLDYLVYTENPKTGLIHCLVLLYIEDFEIDRSAKKLSKDEYDVVLRNINNDEEVIKLSTKYFDQFTREILKVPEGQQTLFNANSFINKKFDCPPIQYESVMCSLQHILKIEHDNYLVKAQKSLCDACDYLVDDYDYEVVQKVKFYDYKNVFCRNPTQIEKKKGEEFSVSLSELPKEVKEARINSVLTTPSQMILDVEDNQENIQKFLLRKIKRNTAKLNQDLPENIKKLIKNYGDICVNLSQATVNKYEYYQKFYEFAYKETA